MQAYSRKLLYLNLFLFTLLVVNSVYLVALTLLQVVFHQPLQNEFYLLMFLAHLIFGSVLILPTFYFVILHLRNVLSRPNKKAKRAGFFLLITVIVLFCSGLILTRIDFIGHQARDYRQVTYALHVISPFVLAWFFILHRLAGTHLKWKNSIYGFGFSILFCLIAIPFHFLTKASVEFKAFYSPALIQSEKTKIAYHQLSSERCANCHQDIAKQWQQSMHHFSSFNNPAYRVAVENTRKMVYARDKNVKASRVCAACHDIVPLLSGKYDDINYHAKDDPGAKQGVNCIVCHAVKANGVRGNGDFSLALPSPYPFSESTNTLSIALNQLLIRAKPEQHKQSFLQPLHQTAEFCSTCHKAFLPFELNHHQWLRGQNHYDSFLLSGVSGHRVDSFYYPEQAIQSCNECHMPLIKGFDPAGENNQVHDHRFAAANTGVTALLNLPKAMHKAQQVQLKKCCKIDIFGVRENSLEGQLLAPLRPKTLPLEKGKKYIIEVVISTVDIGHHLTQGTADSNQLWLEAKLSLHGKTLSISGALSKNKVVDKNAYFVNTYLLDKQGKKIVHRNVEAIYASLYNHQIPPDAATTVHYLVTLPDITPQNLKFTVNLYYRKFDTLYYQYIKQKPVINTLPVTLLASDNLLFSQQSNANPKSNIPTWRRYNDYGIGLLSENSDGSNKGMLRQAIEVFKEVEKLKPEYGALNLVRVYLREGDIKQAIAALARAKNTNAPSWTVSWFDAIIQEQLGHYDQAIILLKNLLTTQFKDARIRGFNFSYDYRARNQYARLLFEKSSTVQGEARKTQLQISYKEFLTVLAQDPENTTALYYLSLLAKQMRLNEKAKEYLSLYEKYNMDDNAVAKVVATHRKLNPAANHAAQATAVYPLFPPVNNEH